VAVAAVEDAQEEGGVGETEGAAAAKAGGGEAGVAVEGTGGGAGAGCAVESGVRRCTMCALVSRQR